MKIFEHRAIHLLETSAAGFLRFCRLHVGKVDHACKASSKYERSYRSVSTNEQVLHKKIIMFFTRHGLLGKYTFERSLATFTRRAVPYKMPLSN